MAKGTFYSPQTGRAACSLDGAEGSGFLTCKRIGSFRNVLIVWLLQGLGGPRMAVTCLPPRSPLREPPPAALRPAERGCPLCLSGAGFPLDQPLDDD